MAMHLDVIVPTYNRQDLLGLTLESLFAAEVPSSLEVAVIVVDNNSKDQTQLVVEAFRKRFGERIRYLFEPRQGRSHALNAGIASATGDLVGMIDDDEEVDPGWYKTAFEAFSLKGVDFIGGPYEPRWGIPPPGWLPQEYRGVVGWVDGGKNEVPFDSSYPGILMGGNAVIRRSVLEKVGGYTTWLGRTDKGLLSCEDEDIYFRLLASGAKGLYLPNLIIYHHVPPERLTKSYFRRWCFWHAVSLGLLDRTRKLPCRYLLGIPRWRFRKPRRDSSPSRLGYL
jgi:glycosyltransferase involved in cell wall biosynthesis